VLTIAYLANLFPSPVEPYVVDEIEEVRRRGVKVIPSSVWRPEPVAQCAVPAGVIEGTICLWPLRWRTLLDAAWLCVRQARCLAGLVRRVIVEGRESPLRRAKALLHTWLGAYYALQLQGRGVELIHVHHGYFGSWVGMVAARLLGAGFSMTLHGSDLLLHASYLDVKLKECRFCLTVSEYNRRYILQHYRETDPHKVIVSRLGVDLPAADLTPRRFREADSAELVLLAAGRLHAVKNLAFLVRACAELRDRGIPLQCLIAGEGRERPRLESLICHLRLETEVRLLGHIPRKKLASLYGTADVVVLTSRSEGIPVVLMEAMALGCIVLAPAITGIPELVIHGRTGFLYAPGSQEDLVAQVVRIQSLLAEGTSRGMNPAAHSQRFLLEHVRRAARAHVREHFNRRKNLARFCDLLLEQVVEREWSRTA